jgi:hypothetical protein
LEGYINGFLLQKYTNEPALQNHSSFTIAEDPSTLCTNLYS